MSQIITQLKSFNSKERFFLIGHILGNPNFTPSPAFRDSLATTFQLQLPGDVFAAMDYHLDWLYASLFLAFNQGQNQIFVNDLGYVKAQQEDIDFLIAYETNDACHIILLEAKGVGGFTNKQMASKAARFGEIFGMDGKHWPGVIPHFALVYPKQPSGRLRSSTWPTWMAPNNKIPWIYLPIPAGLKKVTRCNDQGNEDQHGKNWTISHRL